MRSSPFSKAGTQKRPDQHLWDWAFVALHPESQYQETVLQHLTDFSPICVRFANLPGRSRVSPRVHRTLLPCAAPIEAREFDFFLLLKSTIGNHFQTSGQQAFHASNSGWAPMPPKRPNRLNEKGGGPTLDQQSERDYKGAKCRSTQTRTVWIALPMLKMVSMSLKVFLKTKSREFSRCLTSHSWEIFETIQHRIKTKVHRTHMRCQFGLKAAGCIRSRRSCGDFHRWDVDHGIGRLLYFGQKLFKDFWILSRPTCFRIPCEDVNGCSSLMLQWLHRRFLLVSRAGILTSMACELPQWPHMNDDFPFTCSHSSSSPYCFASDQSC